MLRMFVTDTVRLRERVRDIMKEVQDLPTAFSAN